MSDSGSQSPILSNRLYNALKWIAQILLPAIGALYFGLGDIWDLPKVTEVVGTIAVIDTFLGVVLGLSTAQYNRSDAKYDGIIDVTNVDGVSRFDLQLTDIEDPHDIMKKEQLAFKVVNNELEI